MVIKVSSHCPKPPFCAALLLQVEVALMEVAKTRRKSLGLAGD